MKTILVPTDFSEAAGNAAEYAIHFSKSTEAEIILFNVFHYPVPVSTEGAIAPMSVDFFQEESEANLKKEAARLKEKTGVNVKWTAQVGLGVDEILEKEKNVDLIVMGMKGAGALSETLIGSVTTALLRKTNRPVLIIPEKAEFKKPEKIVFACDYNPTTDAHTLDALKLLTLQFNPKIYIVNVKRKKETVSVEGAISGMQLENELKEVEHLYYFPENEDLVAGINEFVKDYHADMVVMIPHRYNLMERLFHTSISKKMAFHSHIPMLALPDTHKTTAAFFV